MKMVNKVACYKLLLPWFFVVTLISGCAGVGPGSIEKDRFDYSSAIADSWKKMMLLNIVKMRYGDTPVFLEVGSVVSQYSMETEVNAEADLKSSDLFGEGVIFGGKGKFADKPTITYNPLTGKKFAKSLLTPIPPYTLFGLMQSGWSPDLILRICVSTVNDLHNTSGRLHIGRDRRRGFEDLVQTLSQIQQSGGMGARLVQQGDGESLVFFRRNVESELEQKMTLTRDLLRLNKKSREFRLVFGTTAANDTEIAMLTRSMLDIFVELAYHVRIPAKDVAENRASPGYFELSGKEGTVENSSPMVIDSSREEPADAFIAIEYRDHWFFIRDTDYRSKRVFSFLLFLFTLAESGPEGLSPVLTLPAG